MNTEDLWFNTPDTETLCRAGGNGENHPSQLYAIEKYIYENELISWFLPVTFLDYGAGSGTTYEALQTHGYFKVPNLLYRGLDIIPKNVAWCNEHFKTDVFKVNTKIHEIDEPDKSWDVVYSRHVVDHMKSFEDAMDEHCRVAKKLVIVVLWTGLLDKDEHEIKNIVDHRGTPEEKLYPDEYTNNYSRKKVMEYLTNKEGWKLLELTDNVGAEVKGCDTVIVLERV